MNTEKIKVIAMDLDGTLLDEKKKIPESTKMYLNFLRQKGYILVAITGRILRNTLSVQEGEILFDYVICFGGALLYDVREKKILWENPLEIFVCKQIAQLYEDKAEKISFCDSNYYHNYGYVIRHSFVDKGIYDLKNFLDNADKIYKIEIFFDRLEKYRACLNTLQNDFPNLSFISMQDSFATSKWIEIYQGNVDKVSTLNILLRRLSCTLENVLAFGDGRNDVELLKHAGIGIAMKNALPAVKEVAAGMTFSHMEKGVEYWLKQNL